MSQDSAALEQLRREIDRIDDQLHDLLMRRTGLVERIAAAKTDRKVTLRPGREAQILRRLVGRHGGEFPKLALVRIWREIVGALTGLQGPLHIAVHAAGRSTAAIELARNHFGVVAPLSALRSPGQVVRAVADGVATVGVIPLIPGTEAADDAEPWWTSLTLESGDAPRVVARLPFAPTAPVKGAAEPLQALVIACRDHDCSGDDRTLAVLETGPDVSRDRLRAILGAGGLEPAELLAIHRHGGQWLHMVEILGHVTAADPRLAALVAPKDPVGRIAVIGGYATPFAPEALV
ncbi:Putative Chorismate mutase(Chorismate mutase,12-90) [Magnetospirillum sp. XM-1]|uniref:chorismate mutase n=1 Tax=Magnetospirillum sp. XM-1 TaxID=1663591 RepID=UPI00073DC9CA|nr:chorismate mutase [Magnetospirillum sp. XM-1]CUW38446.1 Putative Chorismate mutase(Chorismate mutase,12-90) [Magnetospirillum sp. XM-1]